MLCDLCGMDTAPLWTLVAEELSSIGSDISVLNPGATEASIAAAEAQLGIRFPDDVRAIYREHDGTAEYVLEGREWLSLKRIVSEWTVWKELLDNGTFEDNVRVRASAGPVKPNWWNAGWIPMTYDGSGNHHCLDLDPGDGGVHGQIITMWHDDAVRNVVAGSFYGFLMTAEWSEM